MEIKIPEQAQWILTQLNEYGFEAYVVGGCVRDSLMGREPGDWDITTNARPEQVKDIFKRTIDTGIQHGTVTIMVDKTGYEVTTYRIDGEYEDGRHPRSVEFTVSLIEDLKRRDFTINAMAYSSRDGMVDAFKGREDLEKRVIRCVGSPLDRFTEDALRILRAVRFSAQLDFSIEEETCKAISAISPNLARVSKERIAVEFTKLLLSDCPDRMALVFELGIAPYISQVFGSVQWKTEGENGCDSLRNIACLPEKKYMRWTGFLKNESADMAADLLKDLKMDNDTIERVRILVSLWRQPLCVEKPSVRRMMSRLEPELCDDLLDFQELFLGENDREAVQKMKLCVQEIREAGDPVDLKQLAVTGKDLIAVGMKPGPQLGEQLDRLFEMVLENPEYNRKETLLQYVKV